MNKTDKSFSAFFVGAVSVVTLSLLKDFSNPCLRLKTDF